MNSRVGVGIVMVSLGGDHIFVWRPSLSGEDTAYYLENVQSTTPCNLVEEVVLAWLGSSFSVHM
jgi:hypothetical protein